MSGWVVIACGALLGWWSSRRPTLRRMRALSMAEPVSPTRSRVRVLLALARGRRRDGSGEWPELIRRLGTLLQSGETAHSVWALLASAGRVPAWEPSVPQTREREDVVAFLDHMVRVTSAGLDPLTGLRTAAVRLPRSRRVVSTLRASWHLAQRTGAPLGDVLARMSEALEDEIHASDARESAVAGPRATARILASLPVIGLGLGALLGTDPWGTLIGTAWGRASFLCGGLLALGGAVWSRRLVHEAVSGTLSGSWVVRDPRRVACSRRRGPAVIGRPRPDHHGKRDPT